MILKLFISKIKINFRLENVPVFYHGNDPQYVPSTPTQKKRKRSAVSERREQLELYHINPHAVGILNVKRGIRIY